MMRFIGFCLLLTVAVSGCSGEKNLNSASQFGGEEGKKIAILVDEFEDRIQKSNGLEMFAADAGKIEKRKFVGYSPKLVGKPTVEGTTANAKVALEKAGRKEPLEVTWQFVKEGENWKIKAAPLQ